MSLIADSLKKIEKGENDAPEKDRGFVAPPLMQKAFGGGSGGGKPPKKSKGFSRILLFLLLGIAVVAGGGLGYLYMTGSLDDLLGSSPEPMRLTDRKLPPPKDEVSEGDFQQEDIQFGAESVVADNGTETQTGEAIDIVQTESAQDMDPAAARNIDEMAASQANNKTSPQEDGKAPTGKTPKGADAEDIFFTGEETNKPSVSVSSDNASSGHKADVASVEKNTSKKVSGANKSPGVKKKAAAKKTPPAKIVKKTTKPSAAKKKTLTKTNSKAKKNDIAKSGQTVKNKVKTAPKKTALSAPKPVTFNDKLEYTSLIAQGESAVDRKNYTSAIDYFKKAGKIENSNVLMGNIAALYIKVGKPAMASEIVIVNKIKDPSIVSSLIIDMASEKHLVQALVLLKYAENNMPPSSQIVYANGYYYEVQKGYVKAAEYYQRAFAMNPKEPAYLYAYARCLDYSEQYYKALESYMKVVSMKPEPQLKMIAEKRARAIQGYLRNND